MQNFALWLNSLCHFVQASLDQTATQVPTRMEKSVDVDPLETDGKKIVHDEKLKEISKNELPLRH